MADPIPFKPTTNATDERRAVSREAIAQARRAEAAGLPLAAYLLELASKEALAADPFQYASPDDGARDP